MLESVETLLLRRDFFDGVTKIVDKLAELREETGRSIPIATPKPEIITPSADEVKIFVDPATPLDFDRTKDGWKLDQPEEVFKRGEIILSLQEIFKPKPWHLFVFRNTLLCQAKKYQADLTQRHVETLLREQARIPESWRRYWLVFPGTIMRNPDGYRSVPYLYWHGGRWYLCWHWLAADWSSHVRLLHSRPVASHLFGI